LLLRLLLHVQNGKTARTSVVALLLRDKSKKIIIILIIMIKAVVIEFA